jgi:hypothetical protein
MRLEIAFDELEVRATDRARGDRDDQLARGGFRIR